MRIILPGEPVAKIRARITKNGGYDPQSKLKLAARFQILDQINRSGEEFPIGVDYSVQLGLHFYSSYKSGEENLSLWGIHDNLQKKDLDNFCKFYLDVMNGLVYQDDSQVDFISASKKCDSEPRIEIMLTKTRSLSDKAKEVFCHITPKDFISLSDDFLALCRILEHSEKIMLTEREFLRVAFALCRFSEDHAETLTKIKKKFPGFAKVLNDEINKRGYGSL